MKISFSLKKMALLAPPLTNGQKGMIAFGIIELILIIFICLATFYTPIRVALTGKTATGRQDAKNKGFGYYSDPMNGQCFSQTGNCQTASSRFVYRKCIPNLNNSTGCIDGNTGLFTYNMIIDEEPCKQQCFSKDIVLDDNVSVNRLSDGTNVVTAVGTHNLVDNITGFDMSDTFIGEFDLGEMNYKLKSCIPNKDRYQGYKVKKYECKASSNQGINGCIYMCGSDSTLTYGRGVSTSSGAVLLFPYYITDNGKKMFYCNDINNNNQVQILNTSEDIPDSFVLPDVCYSHAYSGNPPMQMVSFDLNYNYLIDDPYLFVDKSADFFREYFDLGYTILSDPHSYIRLFVNGESRLLSRFYEGKDGIISFTDLDGVNIGYVPYPVQIFNIEDIRNMGKINIFSTATGEFEIEYFSEDIFEDINFIYVPFDVKKGFFNGVNVKTGKYFYNISTSTLILYSEQFSLNENVLLYMHFDDEPWLPRFQPLSTTDSKTVTIDFICGSDSFPKNDTGLGSFSYYSIPDVTYIVSGSNIDPTFNTNFSLLPLTGNMFVDSFITPQFNLDPTGYVNFPAISGSQPFYIFGVPLLNTGELGFYYPLFLSKYDPNKSYTSYKFEGYQNTTFYLPIDDNSYSNVKYVYGDYSNYDYLRGIAVAGLRFESFEIDAVRIYYWCNPQMLSPGTNYELNTYYNIRGKDARVRATTLTAPYNILETARVGITTYQNVNFIGMLNDQNRNTSDDIVTITLYPEKIIELTYDFRPLRGPYIDEDGTRNYICSNLDGTSKDDGIEVNFDIGQTIVANVIDNNFNTDKPAFCGKVTLPNGTPCIIERNPAGYTLDSSCIVYNPEGQYRTVEDFFERGFLFGDSRKLTCYSNDNSKKLIDSNCQQMYLTDYLVDGNKYSPNEEVILNKPDVKLYISLLDGNTAFPDSGKWATISEIEETYFNTGQYLGVQENYVVKIPGDIYMTPGHQIRYLTLLNARLPETFADTNYIIPSPLDIFKDRFDLTTPYLVQVTLTQDLDPISYRMRTTDPLNPILKVSLRSEQIFSGGKLQCNKLYLEENYLNGLIWFLTTYQFFKIKSVNLNTVEGVNFCILTSEVPNNLAAMNSITRTTLTMYGSNQADLTDYYCWFVPLVFDNGEGSDNPNSLNALYPIQWTRYISQAAKDSQPCKFEVVRVINYTSDGTSVILDRNITSIPENQIFRFISLDKTGGNTECGFLLPFSKVGPLPRIYIPSEDDGSFQISLNFPAEYLPFIEQIQNNPPGQGIVNIYNIVTDNPHDFRSFFNYGFYGFVIDDNIQNPSYTNEETTIVQYEPNQDRTRAMAYVQRFRLTVDNNIYFNEVRVSDILTYRVGDYITLIGEWIFIIVGTNVHVIVEGKSDLYESFDYQCQPLDVGFYGWFNNGDNFGNPRTRYLRINNGQDWISPAVCRPIPGILNEWRFVLFEYRNFKDNYIILTTSSAGIGENIPIVPDIEVADSSAVFYLGFIPATAPRDILKSQRSANDEGILNLTKLHSIRLNDISVITVEEIIGKPAGKYSITDPEKTTYNDLIEGRSFISKFSVTSLSTIPTDLRYSIGGYNFGIETKPLAIVDLFSKTYTGTSIPTYDGSKTTFIYGDLVYFKDYKTNLLFRNASDTRQEFDPDNGNWASGGRIHPQVDYKLYHNDQVYNSGELVKYEDELWKALVPVGLSSGRKVPRFSEDWELFTPTGTLFSSENNYMAIQADMDPDNPSYVNRIINIIGRTHQFPTENMYYNREYRYVFSQDTPMIHFSNNLNLLDKKYNFVNGNFIMEIKYHLSGIETSRNNFIESLDGTLRGEIHILIRRSASSLLLAEEDYEKVTIQFGVDENTDGGEITFYNNNQELTEEIFKNNRLDNQNIPFRIGNFGNLGYCMGSCIKNIDNNPYETTPFGFIDLISSGLVDTYFNNNILSYSDEQNFLALSSEPCNIEYTIEERFLQICEVPTLSRVEYKPYLSQYVYQLPRLNNAKYGLSNCGSEDDFIFANALLWIYVPLDIESQNFLKYIVISKNVDGGTESGVINSGPYFQSFDANYNIQNNQAILKNTDGSYTTPGDTITVSRQNSTYLIENGPFTDEILKKITISMKQDGGDNKITLKPIKFGLVYNIQNVNYDGVNNYDYWWASAISRGDSDRIVFSWGFIYNQEFVPLSFTDNLDTFEPQEGKMNISSSTLKTFDITFGQNGFAYKILDFELVKQTSFTSTTALNFTAETIQNLKVRVEFNNDAYMFQPGDNAYTADNETNLTVGSELYFKLFGDKCLTKIYANFGSSNTPLSYYPTTISGRDGLDYLPLVYNMNKSGILSMENEITTIQSGNDTTEMEEIFMIDNGVLRPNPINLPFNLNHNSTFNETYIKNKLFGVVASGSSSNLYTEPFTNFTSTIETTVSDFPISLNDTDIVLNNNKLRQQMLRLKNIRENYPDEGLICNFILEESPLEVQQDSFVLVPNTYGLTLRDFGDSATVKTNLYFYLYQNVDGNFPISFSVSGNIITSTTTSYSGNQYLTIRYYLDLLETSQQNYVNESNFNKANNRYIKIIYETPLTINTDPTITKINILNAASTNQMIVLNIISNS